MSTELARRKTQNDRESPKSELAIYLESNIGEMIKTCASEILPRQLLAQGLMLVSASDDLKRCTQESVLTSLIDCASLGLSLSKTLGEGCLIPYGRECQFQPMHRGLTKLAKENGSIEYIRANVVHKADEFRVVQEPVSQVFHVPCMSQARGPMSHVYSVVQYMSGRKTYSVLFAEDVETIRQMSKMKNGPAWTKRPEEMWKKCAIKVHCKELEMTPRLARAVELDNREYNVDASVIPQNDSGHGRGQYESEEKSKGWQERLQAFRSEFNARWLDKWTEKDGTIHPGIKQDLVNDWQLDGHLIKWAIDLGYLDAASVDEGGPKSRQLFRYTAILFNHSQERQDALIAELRRYCKECWRRGSEAIAAKYPADKEQATVPREAGDDDDDLAANDEAMDAVAADQNGLGDRG